MTRAEQGSAVAMLADDPFIAQSSMQRTTGQVTAPTGSRVETPFAKCHLIFGEEHPFANPLGTGKAVTEPPARICRGLFLE
ncbi:MAG: hypothetical protein QGH50_01560 [SAR324 cluster bacterium]|nr:hypothetical protein [SAR324 cluster bacterium]HCP35277.1 hypothetical protein [Deltaproteobacteria bacterium]